LAPRRRSVMLPCMAEHDKTQWREAMDTHGVRHAIAH
jgi:hypothetical protein